MTAPKTATMEPIISNLSGLFLSTIIPHNIEEIIKNPPYAAYTLPKWEAVVDKDIRRRNSLNAILFYLLLF